MTMIVRGDYNAQLNRNTNIQSVVHRSHRILLLAASEQIIGKKTTRERRRDDAMAH